MTPLVVAWTVYLVKIEVLAKPTEPNLWKERTAEINEFMFLIVAFNIGYLAQVFFTGYAGPAARFDATILNADTIVERLDRVVGVGSFWRHYKAHMVVAEYLICSFRMRMRCVVL
jgi:hypothetical protein